MRHRRATDTEPRDRILLWPVQLQGQWRSIVLNCPQTDTEDDHPILRREVEAAVQSLKKGKSVGVDNLPAELVQASGEEVITALTTICNKIWQTGEWPTPWTQYLVITLPSKANLQQCQNYRTISLISHPSKVMLKMIQYNTNLLPSDKCTWNVLWYQAHSYTHSHQSHEKNVTVKTLQ